MNQWVLISKVKGSYNRSSILLLSWTFEVWYLHWLDHASLGSHIDFERLMNLSRVKPAILSSKRVLVVKPPTVVHEVDAETIYFYFICLVSESQSLSQESEPESHKINHPQLIQLVMLGVASEYHYCCYNSPETTEM